jgi:hypothetical protein
VMLSVIGVRLELNRIRAVRIPEFESDPNHPATSTITQPPAAVPCA